MRFILTLLMTSAMAFGFACQSASSSSTETKNESLADATKVEKPADKNVAEKKADSHNDHDGEAARISLEDAKKDFDAGEAIFIDTRSKTSFDNEHVKGALNVPSNDFENAYKSLPKDKKIIAYCSWPSENTSARVVQMLMNKGYENAHALVGGTKAWKDAGYPMKSAKK